MLRTLKRQKNKKLKQPINFCNSSQRLIASTLLIAYTAFIIQPIAYAQQIILDGRTNTTVDVNGAVSNVSTSTVHGVNAFNSFSRFNVNAGNTVNLIVPNSATNLINLVNGETSRIDGILNSLKNGQIGGNVYLLNPDGVVFGKNSNVNVGSLNVYTPTKDQMDKYLDLDGNINDIEVGKLTNGEIALTDSGLITADGKINALKDINFGAGNININGDILSGAAFQNTKVDFSDVVNVNGYNANNMNMVAENGEIVIKAVNNVEVSGKVVNDGSNNSNAGNIDIDAGNNIILNENSVISAKGMGENSNGGNIRILAQNDTTFKKNALIAVTGAMLSGNAGFIELSAKKNVNLNGGIFEAFAQNGKNGTILIDPENLYITTNNFSNGANILLEADKLIDVADGIILSTRKLADITSDHETANSTGNSGNLTINASEIKINNNAKLLSFANNGFSSGDINLTAFASRNTPVYADINSSIDIGNNVIMKGNNVSLNATADSTHYFDEDTSSFIEKPLDFLDNFSVFAGYSEVKAESKINIGDGVKITTDNDFTANAETKAEAKITTTTTGVGVSIAKVDSDANITLGNNVSINSGKDINISASNDSKLNSSVTAYYFGDQAGLSTNITVAYGDMKADTKVDVSGTSNLTASSNININASTDKNMKVSATSNSLEDGQAGISVAVSTSEVNNTVDVGGTLKAKNIEVKSNVTVVNKNSDYDTNPDENFQAGNSTKASTDVGSGIGGKIMVPIAKNTGLKGKMSSWFGNKNQSTTNTQSGGTKLALAGGVAYADHTNNSTVNIKNNSELEAKDTTSGSGNIILNSETKEMVEVSAKSFVNPQDEQKKANAVSVAVAISKFNNNSKTEIGDGSTLNASHNIEVKSTHKMPYHITWHQINGVSDIMEKLNGDLGLQNGIFTTWARSTAGTSDGSGGSGDGIGIAGAVNIADFNSTSKAIIGNNVSINQDAAVKTNTQKLIVEAKSDAQTVNFSGIVGLKFFGADAGKGGAGGSYIDIGYDNDVEAIIKSGSTINANYLQVNSDSSANNLSIAVAASKAGKYAFSGSFGFLDIDNTTLAQIDSGSTINIGNINGFSVDDEIENGLEVTANDNSKAINVTGGVAKSKNAGIGASLSVSEINRDTQAIIGKKLEDATVKDNLTLTTDSNILTKAENTGLISTWGLAGAIVSNDPSGVGSGDAASKGGASGSGQYGLAVSGDVGISTIDETVKAYVNDVTLDTKAHNLNVKAVSNNSVDAVSGSASLSLGGSQGKSVGISGSYSSNEIDSDIEAFILDTDIDNSTQGGDITLVSDYTGDIFAISAGASGAAGKQGIAVAGSVSINGLNVKNSSYIKNSTIKDIHDVSLTTTNNAGIQAYGGVLSAGSTAGVGAALALNTMGEDEDNTNSTYISNSTITNTGNIKLVADSDNTIKTITGSVGAGQTSGIAASVSLNKINNNTSAYVENASSLTPGGKLELDATDASTIKALVASAAIAGTVSAGASVVTNDIENEIKAYIDSSNVNATGDVSLFAQSDNTIEALSAAFSASGSIAHSGSEANNEINNQTKSYITNSNGTKKINSGSGNITLTAEDSSEIKAIAGVAAFSGSVGFGESLATNDIDNKVYSYIESSTLTTNNNIGLTSKTDGSIQAITAGGAGAGTASVAASVSLNEIGNETKSYVKNSTLTPSNTLDLNSTDSSTIKSLNASLSLGGYGGIGGGEVTNTIKNKVYSSLENSTVNSDYVNISSYETGLIETGSVGLSGSLGAAASGSASLNTVDNEIKAYISGGTITTDNNVYLLAQDTATINALAGNAAVGGIGVGVSVATNDITNTIESYISGATVNSTGLVDVQANSDQNLEVFTVAGAASGGLSAVASVSLNDLDNTTKAYISNSSNVTGTGGINVKATSKTEDISVKTTGIGLSLGSAFGGTASTIDINNTTEAYVESSTVNAAADKDIVVESKSVESVDNIVKSGSASLYVSANAAYAESKSTSNTKAYLGSNVTVKQANTIKVNADRQVDLYSESRGGTLGQIAVGASIARTTINGSAESYIGDNASIGQDGSKTVSNIDIDASSTITGNSKTMAGSAGILSGNGSDARTTLTPTIKAYLGNNALIDVDNSININTATKIKSIADALGGSFGGIAVGVSIAEAKASPTIETYIGDNVDIEAKEVNLVISHNNGISDMAKAYADTSAGALIGGNGSLTLAQINSTINSYIGKDAQISATDNVSLAVNSYNAAQSNASGRAYGLVAGGYTEAKTDIDENNQVYIKANTVTGKSINAKNVNLTLKADKYADTNANAGSGGLVGGTGSLAELDVTSNNKVYTGDSISTAKNNINATQNFVLDADSVLLYKTTNNNSAAGVIAAGVPYIYNDTALTTDVKIGSYNNITTGEDLTLDGYNKTYNFGSGYSLVGGASGLAGIGSGGSATNADSVINAAIGSYSDLDIGSDLNMLLNADSNISESSNLVAQGAITYADIDTSIDIDNVLTATFDTGSTVDTYNNVNTYLKSNTSATAQILSECKGLAPIANGTAKANVSSTNFINIKGNSLIRPNKDAYFVIGKDISGNTAYNKAIANARGDSAGLLWDFGSVSADADVGINNDISIAAGANITAGEDINLLSNSGSTYSSGYSVSKSKFYLLFGIPITRYKHGGSSDTSTSNNVVVNGAVKSGLYNNRKLTIAIGGTVTEDGVNLDGTAEYAYNQADALQVEIDSITADIVELNTDLTAAKTNEATVQATLTTKNTEKTNLETDKTTKANSVTTKTGLITTNTTTVNANNASILLKQAEIAKLDPKVEADATKIATLEDQITALQGQNTTLNTEIATLQSEVSTLNGQISDINSNIITKNNEISEAQADLTNKSQIVTNIGTDIENLEANKANLIDAKADCAGGTTISALKVKPATIDSGYVNINGSLSGTGSITAPGNDFSIEVLNRSTKNLVFDVLKINQNANGDINLNGSKLTSNYGGISINPGANKGKKIDIYNAFDPDDPSVDLSLLTYKDSSDILFSKDIENLGGDFTVRNMSGSVISQGLINAKNVFIYVPKGDYIHEFTKGRYMTGGTAGTSILYAGENIIISAQKIDVNGTIQSGTDYRSVVINDFNPLTDLTYNDVTEKTELIPVTTLGSNKDINGIKAVWDPLLNRIKLYRADIRGGNIVLQGEILSSGNGKLKVVSGYGEINVINNTNYDLEVNQLNTNQEVNGKVYVNNFKISNADANSIVNKTTSFQKYIKDKGLEANQIEISRDDSKTIHVKNSIGTDIVSPNVTISGQNNATYTPNSDAVYYEPATGSYGYWKYIPRSGWTEFWHGKRYDWTIVTYSYTATIPAKQPIGIEFLGKDQGLINITNNGTSNIYLKENIMNNSGDINISNAGGSILNLGNSTIQSKNINLNAKNNIGNADTAISTDLRDGYLNAVSSNSGLINIEEKTGQMLVNKAITAGDLTLTADGAIRQTGYVGSGISGHNVSLNSVNADVGTISQDILVSTTGSLNVDAQSSVFITENGDIKADIIKSEDGDVKLTATSIDSARNDGKANITAKNITLNSTNNVGNLASDDQALFIETTGDLNIQAGTDIHLNALSSININKVYSNAGNVKLLSQGNINANVLVNLSDLDAENKTNVNIANIKGNNLDLISEEGGISNVNVDLDGIVNAQAQKSVILSNTNHVVPDAAKNDITLARTYVDDLRIGTVYSETGDVVLTSERAILDAKAGEDLNISGTNVALTANLGSIGTVGDDLNIKSTGLVTASAYDDIYITSPNDLNISSIDSSAKEENKYVMLENVVLKSTGNILDGSTFEDYNIESKNITLNVAKIGEESNYLDVNSDVVNATAPSGIHIKETDGDLNITAGSTSGNIMTTANDGAINASVSAGGFLRASAKNNISITETAGDMLLDTIESTNGDIGLTSFVGSITDYNSTSNNITGKNIVLTAANSINSDIIASGNLNMAATNSSINADVNVLGTVTSDSKGDTFIKAITGDINANTINSQTDDITLIADNSILDANSHGTLNLSGKNLNLTATNGQIDSDITSTEVVTAEAKHNIDINAVSGDINANTINSQTGDITLKAANSILDTNLSGVLNISGKDLTLTATNGQIDTDITSTGIVTANAPNSININAVSGDINVNTINSQTGDVTLTADNSILDALDISLDNTTNITGKDLTLTAKNGSIGSLARDLIATASNKINMTAKNDITTATTSGYNTDMEAQNGNINIKTISSTNGDVTLTAGDSILDALDISLDNTTNITGKDLTLIAKNGSIGSLARDLIATASNTINMTAKNDITTATTSDYNTDMEAQNGNINIKTISSTNGDVTLKAGDSILDVNSDDSANVTAKDITLTAVNGSIGSSSSDLRTISTNKINMAAKNSIYLAENTGDLVSDSIKADTGSIKLTTENGNVKINNISAPEDINIIANGDLIDIETIDPKKIDLAVSNTGGTIDVNKGFVSEYVKMTADNIVGNFEDTTGINPLTFYITANKDANAKKVNLNVNACSFGIEKFASDYAKINSQNDALNWQQVKIGDRLDLITPSRTILLKNTLGHLDLTKDAELYETGWFKLVADTYGVKTSAFVKYVAPDQKVNWDSQPVKTSESAVSSNNSNMSKSQEDTHEALNPPDLKEQIQNKRDTIRYTINTDGIIKIADSNINIKVIDISSGGAGISVDKDVPIGEQLDLKLNFNGLEINAKSTVVSKHYDEETGTYKLGLKFIDIPDDIAQQIPYACMSLSSL